MASGDIEWVGLDVGNSNEVEKVILRVEPDAVIHAAALTNVDECETNKEKAYIVNFLGSLNIAKSCRMVGCYVIYVSTDYIFDGSKGLYKEKDTPNPLNYYGLTKLLGEVSTLATSEKNLVIRVSGLYGHSPSGKKNFGITALEKLVKGERVKAFVDQYLSPTYVPHLSYTIAKLIKSRPQGVLHIAGERMSRYEFALLLSRKLGADESLVIPISITSFTFKAKRPLDSSLDTSKATSLGLGLPSQEVAVEDFIKTYFRFLRGK